MLSPLVGFVILVGGLPHVMERPSYVFQMHTGPDQKVHLAGQRYQPRSGDLILFDSHDLVIAKAYSICGSGTPLHAGIIFRKENGGAAVLEAGTNAVMKVFVFDLDPRLHGFDGTILVRRLRTPLSPERERQLRDFAVAQEGKPYALGRAILHASPFRPRDPGVMSPFGRTVLDRDRWICSELAIAAATVAGVLNENEHPANLMLPRDLAYDERYDLSRQYETPALWYPHADVDQVGAGVRVGMKK